MRQARACPTSTTCSSTRPTTSSSRKRPAGCSTTTLSTTRWAPPPPGPRSALALTTPSAAPLTLLSSPAPFPAQAEAELADVLAPWAADAVSLSSTYTDRGLDKALKQASADVYKAKCADGAFLSKQIGNSYSSALYVNLAALVSTQVPLMVVASGMHRGDKARVTKRG